MGNRILIAGAALCFVQAGIAQGIPVKGKVKVASGYPIPEVTVKAVQEKRTVFTDSAGEFAFNVSPYSTVLVRYEGYEDAEIKVFDKPIDTVIIMRLENGKNNSGEVINQKVNNDNFQSAISAGVSNPTLYGSSFGNTSGTLMPSFVHKEETQGSRYFYNGWLNGSVVTKTGMVINDRRFGYNYDKIKGELLFTEDKQSAMVVEGKDLNSFTLIDKDENQLLFRIVPEIDPKLFVNVLSEGSNYNFYKLTQTTFIKSNYRSDGMTSTGNPYDEYEDKYSYWLENVKTKQFSRVTMKRKALKLLLTDQKEKSDRYFSDHRDEAVDQAYVKDLIDFVNK